MERKRMIPYVKEITVHTSSADRQGHRRKEDMVEDTMRGKIKWPVPHTKKITIHTSLVARQGQRTAALE
jgi:hypothetical protein